MTEASEHPYILCPDLETHGVRVAPLWFRPKGGGQECPVILLENVPIGFNTALEAMGFLKRPGGWLIDVREKGEHFWQKLFGDIAFVQRKPVKVYEPDRIVFAPPPPAVKVIVENYSPEHIQVLTKSDKVIGFDAVRACKSDAGRGAVTCRGAWSVIRGACLDRLRKSPEDVQTFEYAWSTAKAQGLDATGLPDEIPHEALLAKVVERQRMTAQMEAVIASDFVHEGAVTSVAHVDWRKRRLYSGNEMGGPVDVRDFDEVDILAQTLLDLAFSPLKEATRAAAFSARVQEAEQELDPGDWTDELDIPDLPDQTSGPEFSSQSPNTEEPNLSSELARQDVPAAQEALIPWDKTYRRLAGIAALAERRVPYARVLCRYFFDEVVHQNCLAINHPAVLANLESLITRFGAVVNRDSLVLLWEREGQQLQELASALGVPGQGRLRIKRVLLSPKHIDALVERKLLECGGERLGWWWTGYSCSRTPNNQQWQLYRVDGDRCHPIGTGLYATPHHADQALHEYVRARRISVFRRSPADSHWFHGFRTTSGSILQLSEYFDDQVDAEAALPQATAHYLTTLYSPITWEAEPEPWDAAVIPGLLQEMTFAMELPDELADLYGRLRFDDSPEGVRAYWDKIRLSSPVPGSLVLTWAEALYHHTQVSDQYQRLETLVSGLTGEPAHADLDISLEDDLLEELEDLADQVNAHLGSHGERVLAKAITSPDAQIERECETLAYALLDAEPVPHELLRFVRSALLFCAQHRPFTRMTPAYLEALRLNRGPSTLFQYAVARVVWLRLEWLGKGDSRLIAAGMPGDLVSGELFPQGQTLWGTAEQMTRLFEALALGSEAVGDGNLHQHYAPRRAMPSRR